MRKVKYKMIHDPKPIQLIPTLRKCIDRMLWYVPGIDSVQSYANHFVDDPLYSEAIFEFIIEEMNIDKNCDVKYINAKKLDRTDAEFYDNNVCVRCQKILLTKRKNETILRSLLRHIRNGIAHGNFNIVGNLVIFKDQIKQESTAIVKINIIGFDRLMKLIEEYNEPTQKKVLAWAFKILGYDVELNSRLGELHLDLLITKGEYKFGIEIKDDKRNRLVGYQDEIIQQLTYWKYKFKEYKITPVFIYDQARVSEKAKNYLFDAGIILLDKRNISELLNHKEVLLRLDQ